MTREELVARIKQHETQCSQVPGASFLLEEIQELADGVILTLDSDGEYTIYYDKTRHMVHDDTPFEDESSMIANFPSYTGFITNVMARSWDDITETAKMSLVRLDHSEIDWHKQVISLEF